MRPYGQDAEQVQLRPGRDAEQVQLRRVLPAPARRPLVRAA